MRVVEISTIHPVAATTPLLAMALLAPDESVDVRRMRCDGQLVDAIHRLGHRDIAADQHATAFLAPPRSTFAAQRILLLGLGTMVRFHGTLVAESADVSVRTALECGHQELAYLVDRRAPLIVPVPVLARMAVWGAMGGMATTFAALWPVAAGRRLRRLTLLFSADELPSAQAGVRLALEELAEDGIHDVSYGPAVTQQAKREPS